MKESLAQTLRGGLYDNPLVLLDRRGSEPIRHFLSDPELEDAAHLVVRRVAPACPMCEVKMTFVQANDFEGWSCMGTAGCVYHLPLEKKVPCQLCGVGLLWHEKYEISGRYRPICKSCFDKNK